MSATLDAELFEKYFNAKVIYVKGRQFPVRSFFTLLPEPNYIDATLITILQVSFAYSYVHSYIMFSSCYLLPLYGHTEY
jgi:HrpA-like RNA helicase